MSFPYYIFYLFLFYSLLETMSIQKHANKGFMLFSSAGRVRHDLFFL